jgi:hypothetical protein
MAGSPARIATLVAIPVALLAGALAYFGLRSVGSPATRPSAGPAATGPVAVAAPALDEPTATVCRALVAALPNALGRRVRRPVSAGSEQNAAYGDPAVTLSCGAPAVQVPEGDQVWVLSGVCWYAKQDATGQVWTTVDRGVPVRVAVPKVYDPPGQVVTYFSDPIANSVPATPSPPTGCTTPGN